MPPALIAAVAGIFGVLFAAFMVEALWTLVQDWRDERRKEKLRWK